MAALAAAGLTFLASPASAFTDPAPPFHECPAVGSATGCAVLLVFEPDGTVSVLSDPKSGNPYDGDDDTEIGVLNESGTTIPNVALSSQLDIFGFDGDGPCSGEFSGTPAGCPFDTTGYAGPGVTYTGINGAHTSGVVNFAESCTGNTSASCATTPGLTSAHSAFFALEENLTGASIIIPKASPTIATTPSASVPVGGNISDSAALAGGRVPSGTLTFTLFGPGDPTCRTPISVHTVPVTDNGTYHSGNVLATAPGIYNWEATYDGDANNNGYGPTACGSETVTVTKDAPTIATTPSASVAVGGNISDTATLSGSYNATGAVTFTLYGPGDTTCQTPISTLTVAAQGNGTYSSGNVPTTGPGDYNWEATYSGDANNFSAGPAACGAETVTVTKDIPTISTTPSVSVPVGGRISDSATLASSYNATGTVTFTLYAPGDTTCQTPISTLTKSAAGNGTYASGSVLVTSPGIYNWEATYSGDANNFSAGPAACGTETVKVTPQILTGRAYGLTASASLLGLQLLNIAPTPDTGPVVTTQAETVAPPCVATLSGLINAAALCAKVVTSLNPSASNVQASVTNTTIGITGLPLISVGAVQSQSSITCTSSAGSTTIAYLSVGGVVVISKPTVVAPNTRISVLGISLILNEQIATPGVLTVNAVHVQVNALGLNAVTANVVLASSTSDISNCP